jgi:L-lactate dehydrogenase complex protein LldE
VKVSLFVTCLVDQLFPQVGLSTARLLRRLGCEVDAPRGQVCCGQPAFNSGYVPQAREVARSLVATFEDAEYVVSPSGSCCGMVRHFYPGLFASEAATLPNAQRFVGKAYELSEFIVRVLGVTDVGAVFPHRVTYHPSCHGSRLLGVRDEPMTLLRAVRGVELAPLPRAEDCCGFGGTFSVKMSEASGAMVDEKVDHVVETQAQYLVGTDMGCLMNIAGRLQVRGVNVKPIHLAELLDQGGRSDQKEATG